MKIKCVFIVLIIFVFVLALGLGVVGVFSCFQSHSSVDDTEESVRWIPEESSFVDYTINGEHITFRYSICFVNETEEDVIISLAAKFHKKQLKGWVEYKPFYDGYGESGERLETLIKSGEKTNVIYVFEGKYLGGPVNLELEFPEELALVLRMPDYN